MADGTPRIEKLVPLPPQLAGLPWPSREWPRGELDPRVDRVALEKLLDHAFAQPEPDDIERTHAVVIVRPLRNLDSSRMILIVSSSDMLSRSKTGFASG